MWRWAPLLSPCFLSSHHSSASAHPRVSPGSQGSDLQWAEHVKGLGISVRAAVRERWGGWEPANELRVGPVGDQLLLWRAEQGQRLRVGDRAEAPRARRVRDNKAFKATGVRRDYAFKEERAGRGLEERAWSSNSKIWT